MVAVERLLERRCLLLLLLLLLRPWQQPSLVPPELPVAPVLGLLATHAAGLSAHDAAALRSSWRLSHKCCHGEGRGVVLGASASPEVRVLTARGEK